MPSTMRRLLGFVLAGILWLGVSVATVAATSDERLAETEVFGFLPYWELARADTVDLDTLTTIAWFGVEAGRDGRLIREVDGQPTPGWEGWTSEAFGQLRERAQAAGVRVVLTVERFSWSASGKRETRRLLSDPDARATLAEEIVAALTEAGADGVNLDFEPLPSAVRGEYVRLVRAVRRALDAVDPTLQLTFDLTPDVASFPLSRLVHDDAADAAVLMAYEYRTAGSHVAGSVAPLRDPDGLDVRTSLRRARADAPADRLILATPWYGRAWSTRSDEPGAHVRRSERYLGSSSAYYRVSIPRAVVSGRYWDKTQGSAWTVYQGRSCETCPISARQLWYDDVDSVKAKVGLALRRKLRGVGVWALGYQGDRPELWSALRYSLSGTTDRQPPSGVATVSAASVVPTTPARIDGSVPLVADTLTLELSATDEPGGSGVAFVRVATRGGHTRNGSLTHGTTFPAVDELTVSMPFGGPLDEVFSPAGEAEPDASQPPAALLAPENMDRVVLRVQWRDIAGNWSTPLRLPVEISAPASPASGARAD
jgi:spore germination protein YaaH